MTTDDQMDAELLAAGQRWRAANATAPAPGDLEVLAPGRRSRAAKWAVVASAAVVVAALAGGTAWITTRPDHAATSQQPGPVASGGTAALTGITWHLTQATNASGTFQSTAASAVTLHFAADGSVLGSDGINTFSGPSHLTSGSIQFGQLFSTAIGSISVPAQQLAQVIQSVVQGKVTWTVSGSPPVLVIIRAGVGTLTFSQQQPPAAVIDPAKLPGTWDVVDIQHTTESTASDSPVNYAQALTIRADGTFTVQFRCFANAGKVVLGRGLLTWSDEHFVSAIPCPATATQQAEQDANTVVASMLSGETSWQIVNGDLTISKDGYALRLAPKNG